MISYVIRVKDPATGEWIEIPAIRGSNGADGITPQIGTNGNWYIGTTDTGKPSRGEQGAPGQNGADGYTPVRGTDYWTAADKAEIVDEAAAAVDLTAYRTASAQDDIDDAQDTAIAAKYTKPSGGIPKTDLASAVQTSLGLADSALQEHQSLSAYRTSAAQDVIDNSKVDKVTGKGLSTNDFTTAYKDAVDANTTARHTHDNKSVLDGITSALVSAWNTASTWVTTNGANVLSHLSDTVKHITAAERTAWNGKLDASAVKTDPNENVYRIESKYLAATYDDVGNDITATYATKTELNGKLSTSGDGSNVTAAFTQASTRANIATGEKLSVIFGKLSKWFADLKTVAFTGSYTDLSNKPSIPAAQVNADWNSISGVSQILNKPTIPEIPETVEATSLSIDTTVTSGSANLITSGAVYTAVGNVEAALEALL